MMRNHKFQQVGHVQPSLLLVLGLVFLPFAAGHFFSYFFRIAPAVLAEQIQQDFGLSSAQMGLTFAAYFAGFTLMQLPLAIALDRYGPRKVQIAIYSIAVLGMLTSAIAPSYHWLFVGRFMIGVGVSAGLMAGLKAMTQWFSLDKLPRMNSALLAIGVSGGLMATYPLSWLAEQLAWQTIFLILAGCAMLVPLALAFLTPEPPQSRNAQSNSTREMIASLWQIALDWRFWSLIPGAAITMGSVMAFQSLWAGPWLNSIFAQDQQTTGLILLSVMLVFSLTAFMTGELAQWWQRRKWRLSSLIAVGMLMQCLGFMFLAFIAEEMQLASFLRSLFGLKSALGFAVAGQIFIALASNVSFLAYAYASQTFGAAQAARANALVNLLVFGLSWFFQSLTGFILDFIGNPLVGFHIALGLIAIIQAASILVFFVVRYKKGAAAW